MEAEKIIMKTDFKKDTEIIQSAPLCITLRVRIAVTLT